MIIPYVRARAYGICVTDLRGSWQFMNAFSLRLVSQFIFFLDYLQKKKKISFLFICIYVTLLYVICAKFFFSLLQFNKIQIDQVYFSIIFNLEKLFFRSTLRQLVRAIDKILIVISQCLQRKSSSL